MKKIVKALFVALVAIMFFASCGSTSKVDGVDSEKKTEKKAEKKTGKKTDKKTESKKTSKKKTKYDQAEFDDAYARGDYNACLAMLELRKSDLVLTELDSSMLKFYKQDYMESAREFVQVQKDMQSLTKDVTGAKSLEATLAGENSVTYSGTTYERILAYSMKVVNAFKMGEVDRAIGVMNEYTGNYKEEIAAIVAAQKELDALSESDDGSKNTLNELLEKNNASFNFSEENVPAKGAPQYESSEFLAYLGTLAYAANGDLDHAKDFSSALKNKSLVKDDLSIPAGMGRLDVVTLADKIGLREDSNLPMQTVANVFGVNVNFKIAYPVFKKENQKHTVDVVKVTLSDGTSQTPVLVEDFDEAVAMDVASKAYGAYKRSLTRNITKNTAALATGITTLVVAQNAMESASGLKAIAAEAAYVAAVAGVNKACAAVVEAEKADVRQGAFFPHKASTAGFTVAPGSYVVTIDYSNGRQDVIPDVVVSAGKPTVVVSECLNSNNTMTYDAK